MHTSTGAAPRRAFVFSRLFPVSHPRDLFSGLLLLAFPLLTGSLAYTESAPGISSTPQVQVLEGQTYTYDVDASGTPAPAYSLMTAPTGMGIDPASGLVSWTPEAAGYYDVAVQAGNSQGVDTQKFTVAVLPAGGYVWPTRGWPAASPADMHMDPAKLFQAMNYALGGGGSGYILRHGRLVLSWGSPTSLYDIKSATKGFGSTALGLLVKDGKMRLEDQAQLYYPSLGLPPSINAGTGWLGDITLQQLATHTAGFEKCGGYGSLIGKPGTLWSYSDGGANWLAEAMTLTFQEDLNSVLFRRVFGPIGITGSDLTWRSNIYRSDTISGIKNREIASGISASVDALARLGYLYLRQGTWNGQAILPQSYIDRARVAPPENLALPEADPANDCSASEHYGILWWTNTDGSMADAPRDTYFSWGLYESLIVVIPSLDIIAVRAGNAWQSGDSSCFSVVEPFIGAIAQSVADAQPEVTPTPASSQAPTPEASSTPAASATPIASPTATATPPAIVPSINSLPCRVASQDDGTGNICPERVFLPLVPRSAP